MTNIVVMGECMVEFSPTSQGYYKNGFAGDVYNTAVYVKRLLADKAEVAILTAVGNDNLSTKMLSAFEDEKINTTFVLQLKGRAPGAYLIDISEAGERNFSYWRDNSAAKSTMSMLDKKRQEQIIGNTDVFYFSGISLAILNKEDRELFWHMLLMLKSAGKQIVFDSNYRERLWLCKGEAVEEFEKAFAMSDIVFAGVEDLDLLLGFKKAEEISSYLASYSIDELIIKNGEVNLLCIANQKSQWVDIVAVDNVVDTTSAGDSFNAGYLSARDNGLSVIDAAKFACRIAGFVIQQRGAIVDKELFSSFKQNELSDIF